MILRAELLADGNVNNFAKHEQKTDCPVSQKYYFLQKPKFSTQISLHDVKCDPPYQK